MLTSEGMHESFKKGLPFLFFKFSVRLGISFSKRHIISTSSHKILPSQIFENSSKKIDSVTYFLWSFKLRLK